MSPQPPSETTFSATSQGLQIESGPSACLTPVTPVRVGDLLVGAGALTIIAGPCVLESAALAREVADTCAQICRKLGLPFIFKASFDKANRTSHTSFRGPGLVDGLKMLAALKRDLQLPVTTDVHLPEQATMVAEVADLLQVPAFLSRQTDLLEACGATQKPVNIKKGQFLSPWELAPATEKARNAGAHGVLQTERGVSFGYQNLVVDMRSMMILRENGWPVVFDATHSVQMPGGKGSSSGGMRQFIPTLVRAAVGAGIDALFLEVHPDPQKALSDGPNMVPLSELEGLLEQASRLHACVRALSPVRLKNDPDR